MIKKTTAVRQKQTREFDKNTNKTLTLIPVTFCSKLKRQHYDLVSNFKEDPRRGCYTV